MDWQDEAFLLTARPHGESAVIIDVMTQSHGRHAGVVRGGLSRRLAPILQPGNQLAVSWRARLEDHMGAFTVEPVRSRSGALGDRLALAGLSSVCALLHVALAERDPHPALYTASTDLLDRIERAPDWQAAYAFWEVLLLEETGYGLDLTECAITGGTTDLAYVSPQSGRAVGRAAAAPWADRLLPLSPVLKGARPRGPEDVLDALAVTGHFLERHLLQDLHQGPVPEARRRLVDLLARAGQKVAR